MGVGRLVLVGGFVGLVSVGGWYDSGVVREIILMIWGGVWWLVTVVWYDSGGERWGNWVLIFWVGGGWWFVVG